MPEFTGRLRTPRLSAAPSSPVAGEMYYDTATNTLYWWNGTSWISASGSAGMDLVYNGAFPANTPYTDGDIVIAADGLAYMCVQPTSAAPTPWATAAVPGKMMLGTYAARPAANLVVPGQQYFAYDSLGTWTSDGSQWFLTAQRPAFGAASMLAQVPWSTPYEGMEVLITDSYSAPSFTWKFRYNSQSSSAYKWECIGGSPFIGFQGNTQTLSTTNTWTNLAPGLFSIPRNGDYILRATTTALTGTTATSLYYAIYANTVGNNYITAITTQSASWYTTLTCPGTKITIGSGVGVGICGYGLAGSQYIGGMTWEVMPVRIQ